MGAGAGVLSGMEQEDLEAGERKVGKTARELRLAREAAALRANLRKRKEQARAREVGGEEEVAEG